MKMLSTTWDLFYKLYFICAIMLCYFYIGRPLAVHGNDRPRNSSTRTITPKSEFF